VTTLRSLITAGFQDKLVLLRGYEASAAGIDDLGLPSMDIPHLFIPDKLVASPNCPLPLSLPSATESVTVTQPGPLSYKSVLQTVPVQNRVNTPEYDAATNSVSSVISDEASTYARSSSRHMRINPNIVELFNPVISAY
jgi:hypothetical protein